MSCVWDVCRESPLLRCGTYCAIWRSKFQKKNSNKLLEFLKSRIVVCFIFPISDDKWTYWVRTWKRISCEIRNERTDKKRNAFFSPLCAIWCAHPLKLIHWKRITRWFVCWIIRGDNATYSNVTRLFLLIELEERVPSIWVAPWTVALDNNSRTWIRKEDFHIFIFFFLFSFGPSAKRDERRVGRIVNLWPTGVALRRRRRRTDPT